MLLQMAVSHSFYGWVIFHCVGICTLCMYICVCVCVCVCVWCLGFLHILAIVNNPVMNFRVQVSFQINVFMFSGKVLRRRLLDQMVVQFLVSWEISMLFSIVTAPIHILPNTVQEFSFFHIFTNIWYL